MKEHEQINKLDKKKKNQTLPGKSAKQETEQNSNKFGNRFQQTGTESILSMLSKPEFSQPVNIAQKANLADHLQQTYGNANVQRNIQAKLKVGQPNDKYEQEADRVAEHVVGRSNPVILQQAPDIQRVQAVHRQLAHSTFPQITTAPGTVIGREISGGRCRPLEKSTREFMESRFGGYDFSHVRIHTDVHAAESAQAIGAEAYTMGNDVVFARGFYSPGTEAGRQLLAHELVHVVQSVKEPKQTVRRAVVRSLPADEGVSPMVQRATMPKVRGMGLSKLQFLASLATMPWVMKAMFASAWAQAQALGVTIGIGPSLTGTAVARLSGACGFYFGPGGEIGVYGSVALGGGWFAALEGTLQIIILDGGIDKFKGECLVYGVSAGFGAEVGLAAILSFDDPPDREFIGAMVEAGYGKSWLLPFTVGIEAVKTWTSEPLITTPMPAGGP